MKLQYLEKACCCPKEAGVQMKNTVTSHLKGDNQTRWEHSDETRLLL